MARGRSTNNIGGSGPVGCQSRTLSLPPPTTGEIVAPLGPLGFDFAQHRRPPRPSRRKSPQESPASCRITVEDRRDPALRCRSGRGGATDRCPEKLPTPEMASCLRRPVMPRSPSLRSNRFLTRGQRCRAARRSRLESGKGRAPAQRRR